MVEESADEAPAPDKGEFVLSLVIHFAIPAIPLGLIVIYGGENQPSDICLFIAMYSISLGASTIRAWLFGLALFSAFVAAIAYGSKTNDLALVLMLAMNLGIAIAHAFERYTRHALRGEAVFSWSRIPRGAPDGH